MSVLLLDRSLLAPYLGVLKLQIPSDDVEMGGVVLELQLAVQLIAEFYVLPYTSTDTFPVSRTHKRHMSF